MSAGLDPTAWPNFGPIPGAPPGTGTGRDGNGSLKRFGFTCDSVSTRNRFVTIGSEVKPVCIGFTQSPNRLKPNRTAVSNTIRSTWCLFRISGVPVNIYSDIYNRDSLLWQMQDNLVKWFQAKGRSKRISSETITQINNNVRSLR